MIITSKNKNLELFPSHLRIEVQKNLNNIKNRNSTVSDSTYIDIKRAFLSPDLYGMWHALTKNNRYDDLKLLNFCNCLFLLPFYVSAIEKIIASEKLILDVKNLKKEKCHVKTAVCELKYTCNF